MSSDCVADLLAYVKKSFANLGDVSMMATDHGTMLVIHFRHDDDPYTDISDMCEEEIWFQEQNNYKRAIFYRLPSSPFDVDEHATIVLARLGAVSTKTGTSGQLQRPADG